MLFRMFQADRVWLRVRLFRPLGVAADLLLLSPTTALATGPRVILLRGWFGVFSTGLDSIADQLKVLRIEAKVAGHLN
jgi:hypothetical protein